ncbi:MAG: hypothetical protein IPN29_19350 [Saprospiraceae bacterium]|nr:hypothetical protein [Saprospiraceae bacterium]
MKIFLTAMSLMVLINVTSAQDYKSAIGLKLGYGLVGSYKTFLNEKAALDIFGGIRWGGIAAGAYYEVHSPIKSVDRLKWYWGLGGSFTTWDYGYAGFDSYYEVGVSGVLGLDYSFEEYPVNVSVDWAPTIVLLDNYDYAGVSLSRFRSGYGALSVRYILGKS